MLSSEPKFIFPPLVKSLNKLISPLKLLGDRILIGDVPVRFKVDGIISQLIWLIVKLSWVPDINDVVCKEILPPWNVFLIFKIFVVWFIVELFTPLKLFI